jgi:hypothetical protein
MGTRWVNTLQVHPTVRQFRKGSIADWIAAINRAGTRKQQKKVAGVIFFF